MIRPPYRSLLLFHSVQDALSHRAERGTGGWIYALSESGKALLFPWQMTASEVLQSPGVADQPGRLVLDSSDEKQSLNDHDAPANAVPNSLKSSFDFIAASLIYGEKSAENRALLRRYLDFLDGHPNLDSIAAERTESISAFLSLLAGATSNSLRKKPQPDPETNNAANAPA